MKTLLIVSTLALMTFVSPPSHATGAHAATEGPSKAVSTQMAVRDLWVDHIFWIRSVVVAKADKNKKAETLADQQVVENAKKIAGVIEPFYGKPASEKLFGLLAGHYGAVKDYMNATLPTPNTEKQKSATEKLTTNAIEIATFLSGANPNLPKDTLVSLLAAHGGHHIAQINEIQKKDFTAEAQTWADMKQHMYTLSDALVGGIGKQFPEKFK
ncbi:hypothetical protein [Bdellovibrio sp. HCB-162]|uniref:hypothetical protein n=1 Tax=Bdellovibrio sp. HCB-162 TaxID=3394234 RepID=UPI0039BCC730